MQDPILVMQKVPVYQKKTDGQILILARIAWQKKPSGKKHFNSCLPQKITITELSQKIIIK